MSEWREVSVADIAADAPNALSTGPFGSSISARFFQPDGVPVIRGSNLSLDVGVKLNDREFAYISDEKAQQFRRSIVKAGDLVFTCWGTIGQIGLITPKARFDEYVISNKQMKLTPNNRLVDSTFLYYLLSCPEMVAKVTGQSIGAAVPGFNLGQLKEIRFSIPDLSVQRTIASILAGVDELIENNRRRIKVLEQMAQAVYQEWFVKFRYPGHESVPLVDSPLGSVPIGWNVERASDVLQINPRIKIPNNQEYPFLSMGDVSERSMVCFPTEYRNKVSGARYLNQDTLFARITPSLENGKTGFVQFLENGQMGVGSTEFIVLRGNLVGCAFTYCLARSEGFRNHAIASMSGASGRQRVRNECFDTYLLPVPPREVCGLFESEIAGLFACVYSLAKQANNLAIQRDLLLPRLVTGKIDVSKLDLGALFESAME